jgi:hypothetical protein
MTERLSPMKMNEQRNAEYNKEPVLQYSLTIIPNEKRAEAPQTRGREEGAGNQKGKSGKRDTEAIKPTRKRDTGERHGK